MRRTRSATALVLWLSTLVALGGCRQEKKTAPAALPTPVPAPAVRFEEHAADLGISFVHVNGAQGKKWMPETMGGGVAVLDYDGDGRP
ncbi:MAG TPA: CRTAC1 family protein, partial [Thermoanaerobaculia bacterium]